MLSPSVVDASDLPVLSHAQSSPRAWQLRQSCGKSLRVLHERKHNERDERGEVTCWWVVVVCGPAPVKTFPAPLAVRDFTHAHPHTHHTRSQSPPPAPCLDWLIDFVSSASLQSATMPVGLQTTDQNSDWLFCVTGIECYMQRTLLLLSTWWAKMQYFNENTWWMEYRVCFGFVCLFCMFAGLFLFCFSYLDPSNPFKKKKKPLR